MMRISLELFDEICKMVGSKETTEDIYLIFDETMEQYDPDYPEMDEGDLNYLFFIFVAGFINGHSQLPLLGHTDEPDDNGPQYH